MFEADTKHLVAPGYGESAPSQTAPPTTGDFEFKATQQQQPPSGPAPPYDAEDPLGAEIKAFDFDDRTIRRNFIKKVYAILMVQLSITVGFMCLFMYESHVKLFVQSHAVVVYVAFGITLVFIILMACVPDMRRKAPANYIFLFIITFSLAYSLGVTASMLESQEVLLAIGITAAVCLGLTLFAFQTRWDFTTCGGMLFVSLIVLILFGICIAFLPHSEGKMARMAYAGVGVLIFSLYIVYDTQLMIGGGHKYQVSPEEYIFAALNLYLDIINLLLLIMRLFRN